MRFFGVTFGCHALFVIRNLVDMNGYLNLNHSYGINQEQGRVFVLIALKIEYLENWKLNYGKIIL